MAFIHRFGSSRKADRHFHCVVIDGVFDAAAGGVIFHPTTGRDATAITTVQQWNGDANSMTSTSATTTRNRAPEAVARP